MTLVERFIEVSNWPTGRKTALVCALLLPCWPLAWIGWHLTAVHTGLMDTAMLDWFMGLWTGAIALCLLISLLAALKGAEAGWTAYVFGCVHGGFFIVMLYLWGTASTSLTAVVFVSGLLTILYFDERHAVFGVIYMLVGLIAVGSLESAGILPYAPLLIERSIDAQRNSLWFLMNYYAICLGYFFCLALGILVLRARKLQDERLGEAHQQLMRSSGLIRRYIPSQVADAILNGQDEAVDKHTRRKLTAFFSDLVGFTDLAEQMEPEEFSRVLNEYFTAMTAIADRYDGTVDELVGDAILIFFGAPKATDDKDHALRAVRMAQDMQATVQTLNAKWLASGIEVELKVRMGINTGVVTIGNFGSEGRTKYTALGKHINLAARIQAQCEPGKLLISHATWLLVNGQVNCMLKGEMQLKGIHKPVMTYELS